MYYELRTYRLKNGALPEYLRLVRDTGLAIQKRHLGTLVAYFHSDIGPQNEILHIWQFDSLDDRAARRERLAADAEWQAFVPALAALIEVAENRIMRATDFSPSLVPSAGGGGG
ncbi:NIPSNAP family protein [Rhodobacter sp. SGA-6-6]|uniref:NIPSNAP family protein n=1 Tax=Rhodobacter sp. SGA-6-6 TaxID=2710882 RepID=UPI0013EB3396|nr:NIPSNAP family protein [Rhodobacter sp. SGA-6-6]NGM44083.1 NIPSNAP family protein [Rhodobacter sp. SGA-6-6]